MEQTLNFDELVETLNSKSNKARATFMRRFIMGTGDKKVGMSPALCRTLIRYACMQLDNINSKYPEGHPYRERYRLYADKKSKVPAA